MEENEVYCVCLGMKKYGGSFASALGKALAHADIPNQHKIKLTWPRLWEQYLEMGVENYIKK